MMDLSYTDGLITARVETPEIIIGGTNGMTVNATVKSGTDNTLTTGTQTFGHMYLGGVKADIPPGVVTVSVHTSDYGISRNFAQ